MKASIAPNLFPPKSTAPGFSGTILEFPSFTRNILLTNHFRYCSRAISDAPPTLLPECTFCLGTSPQTKKFVAECHVITDSTCLDVTRTKKSGTKVVCAVLNARNGTPITDECLKIGLRLSAALPSRVIQRGQKGRVIPLLRENVSLPASLRIRNWIDFRNEGRFEESLVELIRVLRGEKPRAEETAYFRLYRRRGCPVTLRRW